MTKKELIAQAVALGLTEQELDGLTIKEIQAEMDKLQNTEVEIEEVKENLQNEAQDLEADETLETEESDEEEPIETETQQKPETSIERIKRIRKMIDGLAYKSTLTDHKTGYEERLLLSKAWLGEVLAALNSANPYETASRIENKDQIPPTADVHGIEFAELNEFRLKSKLNKVIELRSEIESTVQDLHNTDFGERDVNDDDYKLSSSIYEASKYLKEARFYLGFELAKIRKS